jgi:membrane protein YdbS with pleckstrin-like domain
MSNEQQPKRASRTVQRLMPARLLLGLAIIAAIIYFLDHTPLRILIPSFALTVLIILLVRLWQRRSGILK